MKRNLLAATAAALAFLSPASHADATFTVPFGGSGEYWADVGSDEFPSYFTWTGVITLVADSDGAGTYDANSVESFSLVSTADNFDWHQGDTPIEIFDGSYHYFVGLMGVRYELYDGRIVDLSFTYQTNFALISGVDNVLTEVTDIGNEAGAGSAYNLRAALVPEPTCAMLCLLGLGVAAAGVRQRRAQ